MNDMLFLMGVVMFFGLLGFIAYQVMIDDSFYNKWSWKQIVKKEQEQ